MALWVSCSLQEIKEKEKEPRGNKKTWTWALLVIARAHFLSRAIARVALDSCAFTHTEPTLPTGVTSLGAQAPVIPSTPVPSTCTGGRKQGTMNNYKEEIHIWNSKLWEKTSQWPSTHWYTRLEHSEHRQTEWNSVAGRKKKKSEVTTINSCSVNIVIKHLHEANLSVLIIIRGANWHMLTQQCICGTRWAVQTDKSLWFGTTDNSEHSLQLIRPWQQTDCSCAHKLPVNLRL